MNDLIKTLVIWKGKASIDESCQADDLVKTYDKGKGATFTNVEEVKIPQTTSRWINVLQKEPMPPLDLSTLLAVGLSLYRNITSEKS